ncbi:MAG: class I SAM-dependent methyltransferase [archaeon]
MIFQFDLTKTLENMGENIYVFEDPKKYDEAIPKHPHYIEMADKIKKEISKKPKKNISILEIGCGPGPLTQILYSDEYKQYDAIEPDKREYKYLCKKFEGKLGKSFRIFNVPIHEFKSDIKYDIIVASFVDHHISPDEKINYYKKIISFLSKDGFFIAGEELLGEYSNNDERIIRLFQYHGYIIKTCIEESNFDMAEIETRALKNGIEKWDEYKISGKEYKKYVQSSGMKIIKFEKIGPIEVKEGGIFIIICKKA